MKSLYKVDGLSTIVHKGNKLVANDEKYYPKFQDELIKFRSLIQSLIDQKKSTTFIHFGDGDYHFLKKEEIGSAKPGNRCMSVPYNKINMKKFKEGFAKSDYICVELLEHINRKRFKELYPDRNIDICTEFLYGSVASKWFFKQFSGQIGLLGADVKMNLIKELIKKEEYKKYIGTDFNDYVSIPQKYACDNLDKVINSLKDQLSKCSDKTKIFLCGIGHVKCGLYHHLSQFKNAVYIDIGSGIDAIAGIIDKKRPYMLQWKNYRIKNFNYDKIDLLGSKKNIKTDIIL